MQDRGGRLAGIAASVKHLDKTLQVGNRVQVVGELVGADAPVQVAADGDMDAYERQVHFVAAKRAAMIGVPVLALACCVWASDGSHGVVHFLGQELVFGKVGEPGAA